MALTWRFFGFYAMIYPITTLLPSNIQDITTFSMYEGLASDSLKPRIKKDLTNQFTSKQNFIDVIRQDMARIKTIILLNYGRSRPQGYLHSLQT